MAGLTAWMLRQVKHASLLTVGDTMKPVVPVIKGPVSSVNMHSKKHAPLRISLARLDNVCQRKRGRGGGGNMGRYLPPATHVIQCRYGRRDDLKPCPFRLFRLSAP